MNIIQGPWGKQLDEKDEIPSIEVERSAFLADTFEWIERGNIFQSFKTSEEAIQALKQDFEVGGVTFSDVEIARLSKMIKRYYYKNEQLKPWRERIKTEEGRKAFIEVIGQREIDPDTVKLDLSHPVFIGVIFKDQYEANKFRKKTSGRIDDVEGWVTLSNYTSDPVLDLTCYFGVEGSMRQQDKDHEVQHLLFGNVYNPELKNLPIGKRAKLDKFDSREDIENNLFLNEVLAYLKANEWPQRTHHIFNGALEGGFPGLSFEDTMILKRKYKFLQEVIAKKIDEKQVQPRDLWKHAQAGNSLDDALRKLFEALYTEEEREKVFGAEDVTRTQQQSNRRFKELLSEFQTDETEEDPEVLYGKGLQGFSPKWRDDFEKKAQKEAWTPEQRYQNLCVERNKLSRKISEGIRSMRNTLPLEAEGWLEEMIQIYPHLDERPEGVEQLYFDLWALKVVNGLEKLDLNEGWMLQDLPGWLASLKDHRLRLMRTTHEYEPYQIRRQELLERVIRLTREIEHIVGKQEKGKQNTNPC